MLLRSATHYLPRVTCATECRWSSGEASAEQMFVEAWRKVASKIDPPKLLLTFMQPRPPFYMVTAPVATGQMGILPSHVTSMDELKLGLFSVHEGNETTKYFVTGGFAFIHPNSVTDIAVEAAPLDKIDPFLVQKGLAEFSHKISSAVTEYEKAES